MQGCNIAFTPVENLHLTLKFLGEISEETIKKVRERLQRVNISSFEIHLGKVGVFSPHIPRILWIKLIGAETLQKKIDKALADLFSVEYRFMGHVTLARIKYISKKKEFNEYVSGLQSSLGGIAREFSLQKSTLLPDGAMYEVIERYSLQ